MLILLNNLRPGHWSLIKMLAEIIFLHTDVEAIVHDFILHSSCTLNVIRATKIISSLMLLLVVASSVIKQAVN